MIKKMELAFLWFFATPILLISSIYILHTKNKPQADFSTNLPALITAVSADNSLAPQVLGVQISDARPYILEKFLKGTPLEAYSSFIIETSDKYNIDYRFIPAIAMKESQGGRTARAGSYNAWGFENGRTNFDSWEGAIENVAKTLKTRYVDKGLSTPEAIMPIYAPPQVSTGGKWAKDINLFFSRMSTLE